MGWSKVANQRKREIRDALEEDVTVVAEQFCIHDKADQVLPIHVDHAIDALRKIGLRRRRFIVRPEAEASLGSFLVGLGVGCKGAIDTIWTTPSPMKDAAACGTMIALLLLGAGFAAHAFARGANGI